MGNTDNLITLDKRTKSERRDLAQKGGKASGAARRAKKTAKEFAIAALHAVVKDNNGGEVVVLDAAIKRQIKKAVQDGDLNALKYLIELIGEAPTNKVDVTTNGKDVTIPQLVFAPTPLTDKDLEEIKRLQSGNAREEDSTDTSISETESGL